MTSRCSASRAEPGSSRPCSGCGTAAACRGTWPSPTATTNWSSTWTTCWASRRWRTRCGAGRMRRWSRCCPVPASCLPPVPTGRSPTRSSCRSSGLLRRGRSPTAAATAGPAATALGRVGGQFGHFGHPAFPARLGMAVPQAVHRHRDRGSGAAADRHRAEVGPHGGRGRPVVLHPLRGSGLAPAAPDPRRARPAAARDAAPADPRHRAAARHRPAVARAAGHLRAGGRALRRRGGDRPGRAVFYADSEAVLAIVRQLTGDAGAELRWRWPCAASTCSSTTSA